MGKKKSMEKKEEKTNVMRLLEQKKVDYTAHFYDHQEGESVDGGHVVEKTGQDPKRVFKTLVAVGASKEHYVFVIPALEELELKKAAKTAGEKSIAMLPLKELTPLTGYIRGGCSPIGMKKRFPTWLDETALDQEKILVSGGRIGTQVELEPRVLAELVGGGFARLTPGEEP